MGVKRCRTIAEVVEEAFAIIDREKRVHDEPDAEFFFRGETKNFYHKGYPSALLESSFPSSLDQSDRRIQHERDLYHDAMRYNIFSFERDRTMVERLIRMQHYRLTTRLADISTNLNLSTFFAVDGESVTSGVSPSDDDGYIRVIKVAKHKMKTFTSDIITAIAHLPLVKPEDVNPSRMNGLEALRYEVTNERPGFSMFIRPGEASEKMRHLEGLLRKEIQHVWAFKAPYNNDRIRNQSGAFLAFGCRDGKAKLNASFSESDYENRNAPSYGIKQVGYVQIHHEAKKEILCQLRLMGMEAEVVYPDQSDVCKAIMSRIDKS